MLAAIGVAQLEQLPGIIEKKKKIDLLYREQLNFLGDINFQEISSKVDANCWLSTLRTGKMRELESFLKSNGIDCRPLWRPMNQLIMYKNEQYVSEVDHSRSLYESCLSIPSSPSLSEEENYYVINKIKKFYS